MQVIMVMPFLLLNLLAVLLSRKFKTYAIFIIQIVYICGQALNVFLVLNELMNDHSDESLHFSLMYFGTSILSDLVIYTVVLSPTIAFPAFVYSPGYLIGIITFAILGS